MIIGFITLALGEIAARVLQAPSPENSMPTFLRQPLLPFRPEVSTVRQSLEAAARYTYVVPDDELGWVVAKNGKYNVAYQSNAQGVRAPANRVYTTVPPPGKVRIVAVGDSFTHCDEVNNDETWEVALEGLRSDLEVLNLGVPGFGTDQALMRYRRDGVRFRPHISILEIWTENICRNLNLVRYYLNPLSSPLNKPRFLLAEGKLKLINSPVMPREVLAQMLSQPEAFPLLQYEYWYDPAETAPHLYLHSALLRTALSIRAQYRRKTRREKLYSNSDPAGIAVTVAIAKQFAKEAEAARSKPIILLIPMLHHLEERRLYATEDAFPLGRALRSEHLEVIDLGLELAQDTALDLDRLWIPQRHLTPAGNLRLAQELETRLRPWIAEAKGR
jgi:hypothetical protein